MREGDIVSMSEKENMEMKERAWRKNAKGHPTRWRMLRDAVAVLSLGWMTISEFQTAMRRIWALKNKTARDMLEELEEEGSVKREKTESTLVNKWGATQPGVKFWIGSTRAIPAGIVQVAMLSVNAGRSEVSKNEV